MIHRTIKGMIRDGPLVTFGGISANFISNKQNSESKTGDAMSRRHKGGDVQAIEYVAQHIFGVTLVAKNTNGA